jgi:hypothetical protein
LSPPMSRMAMRRGSKAQGMRMLPQRLAERWGKIHDYEREAA